jgi:CRP-like cAMP-binding protein
MEKSRSLERALFNYAHSLLNQTSRTALSNGTATLEERLARWLLMANDRLGGDSVRLTHELVPPMAYRPLLGVKRTWRGLVSMSAYDPKRTSG